MGRTIKILSVDDHQMTALGYKYILEDAEFDDFDVRVDVATGYEEGQKKIEFSARSVRYDIILLDISLFPPEAKDPRTGEDLGKLARQLVPESSIVFMSSFSDSFRINSICQAVDPEGYMVKSEIDELSLIEMVKTVTTAPPYYTHLALVAARKNIAQDYKIDKLDRTLLYELSIGTKTKDMRARIPVSMATIDNRKRALKILFGVKEKNDLALIEEARNRGFI
ncbi:response regulator transcription factor [Aggregatimonas sangjinii]|uniref:Response regulator transcription factor n=1 Tax=Aggregatimonas sangjinii TaxID=2583587 RepID=A0A5B7ST77_9FLAO|nr:response regulator transcription factor [Aggregatimonas sangjinii]QCX00233.1 response regulator transcription factor [Aggregatimonas sangjinii]